jgi:hypothetical protein
MDRSPFMTTSTVAFMITFMITTMVPFMVQFVVQFVVQLMVPFMIMVAGTHAVAPETDARGEPPCKNPPQRPP